MNSEFIEIMVGIILVCIIMFITIGVKNNPDDEDYFGDGDGSGTDDDIGPGFE